MSMESPSFTHKTKYAERLAGIAGLKGGPGINPAGINNNFEVVMGNQKPIEHFFGNLIINEKVVMTPADIEGFRIHGQDESTSSPLMSFLYYKLDQLKRPETDRRLVIPTGIGYGVHPEHIGQDPAFYLIACQIGLVHPGGSLRITALRGQIPPKNFSLDCIVGGLIEPPVLANPQTE